MSRLTLRNARTRSACPLWRNTSVRVIYPYRGCELPGWRSHLRVRKLGPQGDPMELVVLFTDSHTLDGCDRVILAGDEVIVQGKPATGRSDLSSISVPPDEILNSISVRAFIAAARELERRIGQS